MSRLISITHFATHQLLSLLLQFLLPRLSDHDPPFTQAKHLPHPPPTARCARCAPADEKVYDLSISSRSTFSIAPNTARAAISPQTTEVASKRTNKNIIPPDARGWCAPACTHHRVYSDAATYTKWPVIGESTTAPRLSSSLRQRPWRSMRLSRG
ncbi:hypothetical protein EV421DRAFT_898608 [Armillaria borealis]|uniref:Uncharacterized protein n=1 Tax=Armillaria borealis TaxID=47425 RepID=A0AA39K0S0_9AGAR|nr:hypothetical protein EV421DRAFT_898608 [Armillaria borealis]